MAIIKKIVARFASLATYYFKKFADEKEVDLEGRLPIFDCKIISADDEKGAQQFIKRRIEDARKNFINGQAFWGLVNDGMSTTKAARELDGISTHDKFIVLEDHGLVLDDYGWERNGFVLYWDTVEVVGFNPITNESVIAERNRIFLDTIKNDIDEGLETYFNR